MGRLRTEREAWKQMSGEDKLMLLIAGGILTVIVGSITLALVYWSVIIWAIIKVVNYLTGS